MSTRARTRTASTTNPPKPEQKVKHPTKPKKSEDIENNRPKPAAQKSKQKRTKSPPPVYCVCRKGDDGTPMVNCGECEDWYHFSCVNLSEQTAEDINVYICPSCTEKTGQRTVMLWEGAEAVEDASKILSSSLNGTAPKKKAALEAESEQHPPSDSGDDPSSEDEYVADRKRRRARRLSFSSESGSDVSGGEPNGRKRVSPGTSKGHLKRKAVERAAHPPAPKRKKAASGGAGDAASEPARAFCLGKLEGVFREIFLRYPHVRGEEGMAVEKKAEELSEDEKAKVEEDAKQFATDLEQWEGVCRVEIQPRDRFRMLQFNLREKDRTVLHKGIASGGISPKELSLMSPADLANEQTKQSIKLAEEEALAHSILEKTAVPRAKLTHKGLEELESVDNDEAAHLREREQARQQEEEEKRARERTARLRTRTASVSVPPESPTTGSAGPNWGAPPRVPVHALAPAEEGAAAAFSAPAAEGSQEPEMNLADLINIDDELAVASPEAPESLSPTASSFGKAPKPEAARMSSFDLNSLWAAPKKEDEDASPIVASPPQQPNSPVPMEESRDGKEEQMDLDETDDMDFDMFLDEKDADAAPTPEALQAAFNAIPQVWSGKKLLSVARQIGGRTLESGSVLWKTLFPSELLRIDGRVPVDKSAHFLLQTRMNSTKELVAILTDFLIAKGRHGLVFPWGTRPKDFHPGKELYIIPLLSSDALPDYMELLDNLHLPKTRTTNYLIGIWVLNKGKLAPPRAACAGACASRRAAIQRPNSTRRRLTANTLNAIPVPATLPPQPQPAVPPPPAAWGHPAIPGPSMGYPPPPLGHPAISHLRHMARRTDNNRLTSAGTITEILIRIPGDMTAVGATVGGITVVAGGGGGGEEVVAVAASLPPILAGRGDGIMDRGVPPSGGGIEPRLRVVY
ncbi:hypothetical protein B0H11DRAFT_1905589 [Mycena galericulata]|nr:hypothetical protein B0H11DRAFT_1905589 [Mycena galericulata]